MLPIDCLRHPVALLWGMVCLGTLPELMAAGVPIKRWALSGARMDLGVATEMDRRYRVESSPDLAGWSSVLVSEPGDGSPMTLGVDAPAGGARFFRVTEFDHEEFRAELAAARERWRDRGLTSYSFEFRWQCHCPFWDWVRVSVLDGQITGVAQASDGQPLPADQWSTYLTVDGLFDWFEGQLGARPVELRGVFEPAGGQPESGFSDISRMLADEERGFELRALAP